MSCRGREQNVAGRVGAAPRPDGNSPDDLRPRDRPDQESRRMNQTITIDGNIIERGTDHSGPIDSGTDSSPLSGSTENRAALEHQNQAFTAQGEDLRHDLLRRYRKTR